MLKAGNLLVKEQEKAAWLRIATVAVVVAAAAEWLVVSFLETFLSLQAASSMVRKEKGQNSLLYDDLVYFLELRHQWFHQLLFSNHLFPKN